jgi:hypothetical protein
MAERTDLPNCFEPYLRYAIETEFRSFGFESRASLSDGRDFRLSLLIEFKQPGSETKFSAAMVERDSDGLFGIEFGPPVGSTRFATVRCRRAAVTARLTFPFWIEFVSRVELSLPVQPSTAALIRKTFPVERWREGKDPPGALLIGVLDDGAPFAANHFLKTTASGAASTRVRAIWDQNQGKQPAQVGTTRQFGQTLPDFNFGLEYRRDFAAALGTSQVGLDEWIGLHRTSSGSIDEDGCYASIFDRVAGRQSHGGHVMDLAAGRRPVSSRIGPAADRRDPPNWLPGSDAAADADIVFVQFSDDCIRDATGVWLKTFVVNGILYVMSFAHPTRTKHVVINLSYGPTTGPHDGTSLLEFTLAALVTLFNGNHGGPKLEIVLAAGNSYDSDGHVAFTRATRAEPDHVEWTWRLPPDNAVLCFTEIWLGSGASATVTLISPSGIEYVPGGVTPVSQAGIGAALPRGNDTMWRLHVNATRPDAAGIAAEHGDWTIRVSGIDVHAKVHAYVARSDPNMGVRSGAKRSWFVDGAWQRATSARANCAYHAGEFDRTGSLIDRFGTLNGIATGKVAGLHVAGSYIVAKGRKSPYASAGPARKGPRRGPDVALPGDESPALQGMRGGGNRSGVAFRLTGTSAAAPQLARHLTDKPLPQPINVPTTPEEGHRRGAGNLPPP